VRAPSRLHAGFVALLACAVNATAQERSALHRVGILISVNRPVSLEADRRFGPFLARLKELGYVVDKDLVLEWRFGEGDGSRLPALADDLVRLKVDAIVAVGSDGVTAAQKATSTIPIVLYGGTDVVAQGFVQSLAHPGGNTTGVAWVYGDTVGKQLEFLVEVVPGLKRLVLLANTTNPATQLLLPIVARAANALSLTNTVLETNVDADLGNAFAEASRERAQGVILGTNNFFIQRYPKIAELALKYRLPSVGGSPDYATDGGLIGCGVDWGATWRRAADYVDRILKGAKPADLPVEQPMKLITFINRTTAKALGLTIPPELLVQADKVIE
jgi:putative tryptophan/tyrosine transport system substrate-binding protein